MAGGRSRAELADLAIAVASDVVAHRLRRSPAGVAARFGAAFTMLWIARAAGVSWADLGLGQRELGAGARAGVLGGACAAMAVGAVAAIPATRKVLTGEQAGERAGALAARGGLIAELASIAFTRVPPEELTYRSVLLGLRLRNRARADAVAWSSLLFGLSHVLPTVATMSRSPLHPHLEDRVIRQAAFVAGNVAVTGMAGAVFAWLRLCSGSTLAPLLAHAALNCSALLASRAAHGLVTS